MCLEDKRKEIDIIDQKICELLNQRFECVEEIKKIKQKLNLSITDINREQELLKRNLNFIQDKYHMEYKAIFYEILNQSKKIQE